VFLYEPTSDYIWKGIITNIYKTCAQLLIILIRQNMISLTQEENIQNDKFAR